MPRSPDVDRCEGLVSRIAAYTHPRQNVVDASSGTPSSTSSTATTPSPLVWLLAPVTREQDKKEKVRENRLRRLARRHGLALRKSGRRDPRALDYGMYAIVDPERNRIVAGATSGRFGFTLDDVEAYLTRDAAGDLG